MVRKDAWYDFNFLEFSEVWFEAKLWSILECSMCTLEGGVFFCIWMACPQDINEIHSYYALFMTCVFLLLFCSNDLSIGVSGVLKSPTIIVLLSISPFMSVSVCLMYWGTPMSGA